MAVGSWGAWAARSVAEAEVLLADLPVRWWISGGYALELHVGRSWRAHDDLDVSVRRDQAQALLVVLDGWEIHVAAAGRLSRWDGAPLDRSQHQNNLWCRPGPAEPWALDVTISDGDEEHWIFRRDPRLRRPWADAVLTAPSGTRYLAPDLQLLFKSRAQRAKDHHDAAEVLPELDAARRRRLGDLLPAAHPWQELLAEH